jgi:4-amino-4-deoxy-L-arabinose transferase-like glycosyltransferase
MSRSKKRLRSATRKGPAEARLHVQPVRGHWRAGLLAVVVFAIVFSALAVNSFRQKSATWDEPIHLTAGYLAAARGDYRVDPSHPPLLRLWAALPLLTMGELSVETGVIDRSRDERWLEAAYPFSSRFLYTDNDGDRLLYPARFMVVLCGVALGVLIFLWAREWLGLVPAVLALAFYTLEPNTAAHARLVTTDLGAALFFFATVYCLWRTCRRPSRGNIAALAACFALAFLAKYSAVILVPVVAILIGAALALRMGIRSRTAASIAAVLVVTTFAAVWAAYGFRYAPSPTEGWLLQLQQSSIVRQNAPALGGVIGWIDGLRLLPNAFTQGFLMSQASGTQTAYLWGEYSDRGWWYYFPVAFALKTPTALLLLAVAGAAVLVWRRRDYGVANLMFVAVPVVVYMALAMASGINLGVRHLLPIYPFVLLVAAAAARAALAWKRPFGSTALGIVVVLWAVGFARVYPHPLTFFNALAGGPSNGLAHLADSNLDWGQDLKLLEAWMEGRSVPRVNLAYFGTADPAYYGIDAAYLPGTALVTPIRKPELPGYVAISASILSGVYLDPPWRLFYGGFRSLEPDERIGNSIYVYRVAEWPAAPARSRATPVLHDDAAAHATLADRLFFDLDWPARAILHYRTSLALAPENAPVLGRLGVALLQGGEVAEAIAAFQRAAALAPRDGDTRYRLALALMQQGRAGEAVAHAEAAVQLRQGDPAARDLLRAAMAARGTMTKAQ